MFLVVPLISFPFGFRGVYNRGYTPQLKFLQFAIFSLSPCISQHFKKRQARASCCCSESTGIAKNEMGPGEGSCTQYFKCRMILINIKFSVQKHWIEIKKYQQINMFTRMYPYYFLGTLPSANQQSIDFYRQKEFQKLFLKNSYFLILKDKFRFSFAF